VGHEDGDVDGQGFARRGFEVIGQRGGGGDELREAEGDSGCNRELANEIWRALE